MSKAYSQIAEFTEGLDELRKIARESGLTLQHTGCGWEFRPREHSNSWKSIEERETAAGQLNQQWGALRAGYKEGTLSGSRDLDLADGKINGVYG